MSDDARYILAKKIARGGMAEIYLGKHIGEDGFQRLCAIKRILPHYAGDQEFVQMFRDEAHICKRLQHANIVRVEGFEEVDGSYAIIMEYVDGADLRTLLHAVEQAKKRMSVPMACFVIAEASRGLHYAHTKVDEITQQALGIVHRDISPQNILVSFEGEVKVTDFGIADAESKMTETRPGIVKGKYSYMSPEQISAKPVDCRTDVFALGIVLWEMLAMRRLFQGDNEVDTIQRVKNCRIDLDLRQLNPEVDEELDIIVKKALAKDAKKRYRTAGDFEKELRRHMSRKFPDYTPEDLGNFLKKNMEARRSETAADIKKTLTETNLKPGRSKNSSLNGKKRTGPEGPDLSLDPGTGPQIALARPSGLSHLSRPPSSAQLGGRTGFNKVHHTRSNANVAVPNSRRSGGLNVPLLLGALAIVLLLVGVKFMMNMTAQSHPSQIVLRTQPSRVKIHVDGKPVNRGFYVHASSKAPLRLTLPPGEHQLLVQRPGYETYKYTFNLENGEPLTKDDIVLKEHSPLAALKIRAKPADKSVRFDINDGYFTAKIGGSHDAVIEPDLFRDHPYQIKINADGEREFSCHVTPHAASWRNPNEVVIDHKARKCLMTGP